MSDIKKYYYLKLKDNFYDADEMQLLQSMDNGYLYSDILMKLYLKSLKHEGKLMLKDHIPYNPKMISTIVKHNVDVVEKALKIFRELGLIEVLDNGAIYMLDIQNFIGLSSNEGDRKREYRKKIQDEKLLISNGQMSDKHPPELDIELDLELKIDKDNIVHQDADVEPKKPNKKVLVEESKQQIEDIWKLYPLKKGKATAIKKIPKLLKENGLEQMQRCIERYTQYVEHRRKTDFKELKYQNGSTFFNGTYVDYLDENYKEASNEGTTRKDNGRKQEETEGDKLARRAHELYKDDLDHIECDF